MIDPQIAKRRGCRKRTQMREGIEEDLSADDSDERRCKKKIQINHSKIKQKMKTL
jgi:hypothetical protein